MAEGGEEGQERTEEPTEKRLREAREQGNIARSKELATAAVFGCGVMAMLAFGGWIAGGSMRWLRAALTPDMQRMGDVRRLPGEFFRLLGELLWIATPIVFVCLVGAIAAPAIMGGIHFSTKALTPDLSKLDPIKGIQRIYSREGLAELVRSLMRIAVIGTIGVMVLMQIAPGLIALMHQPFALAAGQGFAMSLKTLVAMAGGILLIAAIDVPWQLWSHRKKLMMTRQEMLDEFKESEGRPEVKGKIRRMQQEMSQRQMMDSVPTADAVLVNPTHYAVAIVYDAGKMKAPKVVAKGVDLIAATIREVAERNNVPIVTSPALARSLYKQVQIGREIPVNLYAAIAQILSYVYQLRHWRSHGGRAPQLPEISLPDEPSSV